MQGERKEGRKEERKEKSILSKKYQQKQNSNEFGGTAGKGNIHSTNSD
jgi:hypothetical protein